MTQAEKKEIADIIDKNIEDLERNIAVLEEKSKPVVPDISLGRLTRQEARQEQELSKKILEDSRTRIKKMIFAKHRISSENYGFCDICEEPINIERLKIMPESTLCLECMRER